MKTLHPQPDYSRFNIILKILILFWPFLFIWQGIDLTDTGYVLTGGQQVFMESQNVQYSYLFSFIVTGLWSRLTAPLGLMGAYLGSAFLYIAIAFSTYRALRRYIPETTLLLGLLLTIMVPNMLRYINYNNLTALIFVLGSGVLFKANRTGQPVYYLIAGAIFGSSFFFRLPNLVSVSIIPILLAGLYFNDVTWKQSLKGILAFSAGFFFALIIPFLILFISGMSDQYFQTFKRIWSVMGDPSYHHSGGGLIKKVFLDLDKTFAAFLKSIIVLAFLAKINDIFNSRFLHAGIVFLVLVVVCLTGAGFMGKTAVYHYYLLALIGSVLLLQVAGFTSSGGEIRFASLVAFMVIIFGMAGSNTGLSAARYDLWLAMPLTLHGLFQLKGLYVSQWVNGCKVTKEENKGICCFSEKGLKLIRKIICSSLALFFLILCYRFSYKDSDQRYLLRYNVDHPKMHYVFTTSERSRVMTEALNELSKYVMPGDYLLAYNYIPLFHYLTDTKPYAYHSWPEMYTPEQLIYSLKKALKERPALPPVIRAKYPPLNDNWPQKHLSGRGSARHHKVFDQFIQQGKYVQVWENEFFQILLPSSSW